MLSNGKFNSPLSISWLEIVQNSDPWKMQNILSLFLSLKTLQNILGKSPEQESAPDKVVFHLDGFFCSWDKCTNWGIFLWYWHLEAWVSWMSYGFSRSCSHCSGHCIASKLHELFIRFSCCLVYRGCFWQFWRIVVVCPIRFSSCVWCFLSPAHD